MSLVGYPECVNGCLRAKPSIWENCPTQQYICACMTGPRADVFLNGAVPCIQNCSLAQQTAFINIVRSLAINCTDKPDGEGLLAHIAPDNPFSTAMKTGFFLPTLTPLPSLTTIMTTKKASASVPVTVTVTTGGTTVTLTTSMASRVSYFPTSNMTSTMASPSSSFVNGTGTATGTGAVVATSAASDLEWCYMLHPSKIPQFFCDTGPPEAVIMVLGVAPAILMIVAFAVHMFRERRKMIKEWRNAHEVPPTRPLSSDSGSSGSSGSSSEMQELRRNDFPAGEAGRFPLGGAGPSVAGPSGTGGRNNNKQKKKKAAAKKKNKKEAAKEADEEDWDTWERYLARLERGERVA
ncbi:hypothetical protein BU24DRAFT_485211 [Aaosphaeria arxii CBS 175.79]|uniref:Uncharacterized protein n=1 Tax=Aaosphaeria arxii CBS 175.79 TaxID=1450172 RepID=A0A6A5XHW2_9PLEO|nr:uncharacterized protein BU24DRAFT_485211 [Aaosphaeria arxii CBS 175.79]KAF2011904.1 hypothetical protein BU24DRAFT_485211 [Aaosphaeria arxii CBS 175.79]